MQTLLARAQSSENEGRRMEEKLDTSFSSILQSVLSKYTVTSHKTLQNSFVIPNI